MWREDTEQAPWATQLAGSDRVRIGAGWNTYNRGAAVGDLVACDASGVLWFYAGTGKGTFAARTRIGGGWNVYTQLIGVGDSDIDGRADLIAVDRGGSPWRYRATGIPQAPFARGELTSLFNTGSYKSME